jgi:23S rRNA pseudouridine2605 synthase
MRLNQYLASASALSRRSADEAIANGRVQVNGQLATLGITVGETDEVSLDGQVVNAPTQFDYLMLHKPVGYITSRVKQGQSPTVFELLPPDLQHVQSVGRLDKDSSGLLLFTNDGPFAQELSHPSANKLKTYEILLDHPLSGADLTSLAAGVALEDGPSHISVDHHKGAHVTVSLSEGRNRQIRRTFAALGYEVIDLHRTTFGPYTLGDLPKGSYVRFDPERAR